MPFKNRPYVRSYVRSYPDTRRCCGWWSVRPAPHVYPSERRHCKASAALIEREILIDKLLVRVHFLTEMSRPALRHGGLNSLFQVALYLSSSYPSERRHYKASAALICPSQPVLVPSRARNHLHSSYGAYLAWNGNPPTKNHSN